jgi:hypothetical protein
MFSKLLLRLPFASCSYKVNKGVRRFISSSFTPLLLYLVHKAAKLAYRIVVSLVRRKLL